MSDLHALGKQLADQELQLRITISSVGRAAGDMRGVEMALQHLDRAVKLTLDVAKKSQEDAVNKYADSKIRSDKLRRDEGRPEGDRTTDGMKIK